MSSTVVNPKLKRWRVVNRTPNNTVITINGTFQYDLATIDDATADKLAATGLVPYLEAVVPPVSEHPPLVKPKNKAILDAN